jgi:predicted transcriptional regulator
MKTRMRQTSLNTYKDITETGLTGDRQKQVYEIIQKEQPLTNLEVSNFLNLPINCITGRVNELVQMGFIEKKGKRIQATGREAIVWGLV